MNRKYKAIIFDLDGTLIDTLSDLANAANRVLTSYGFMIHPRDAYRYFVGCGVHHLMTTVLPKDQQNNLELIQRCVDRFLIDYGNNWNVHTKPYTGITDILTELKSLGIKLCVFSNKPHELTQKNVSAFFPESFFEVVLGQRSEIPAKPDPAGVLYISKYLNIPITDILFIGDSSVDMKTAVAANMNSVGVLWGFRDEAELRESGAKFIIKHPQEIIELIYRSL
ncbi:MAG: HAD family hydrolase [Desulfobacterales bacterium]|nr:HAD family hydrolase [Desulfobacterales bacterium]